MNMQVMILLVLIVFCFMADGFDRIFNQKGKSFPLSVLGGFGRVVLDTLFLLLIIGAYGKLVQKEPPLPPVAEEGVQSEEGLEQVKGYLHL